MINGEGQLKLAVKIIETSNEDLINSCYIDELNENYYFFNSEDFEYWCDVAQIGEDTKKLIKNNVAHKYNILKQLIDLKLFTQDLFDIKEGNIIINKCYKKLLFYLERTEDVLLYISFSGSVNGKLTFKVNFS